MSKAQGKFDFSVLMLCLMTYFCVDLGVCIGSLFWW